MQTPSELSDLTACPLSELEALYRECPAGPVPSGTFRGAVLCALDTPGARRPFYRAVDWAMFEVPAWGIDFDARRWWFVRPGFRIGHFEVVRGRSRWRPAETLQLRYDVSRLPRPIRRSLYDEIKPLNENLCLGLGGINAEAGEGDHFFFALARP
jgi:hypothetical protein